jgi:hypothetical protein
MRFIGSESITGPALTQGFPQGGSQRAGLGLTGLPSALDRGLVWDHSLEHDLFGKPVPSFPDHALKTHQGETAHGFGKIRRLQACDL